MANRANLLAWATITAASIAVLPTLAEGENEATHGQHVQLVLDYGHGVRKHYAEIPWTRGMTIFDAMKRAGKMRPALAFEHTGSGETVLVTSIDGVKNEGGGREARNWQYWVNATFARKSCGIYELGVDDVIIWRFDTWNPPG